MQEQNITADRAENFSLAERLKATEALNLTERFIILRQYRKENDVR